VKEVVSHEEKSNYLGVGSSGAGIGDGLGGGCVAGQELRLLRHLRGHNLYHLLHHLHHLQLLQLL
jgi:hypothetical protein